MNELSMLEEIGYYENYETDGGFDDTDIQYAYNESKEADDYE